MVTEREPSREPTTTEIERKFLIDPTRWADLRHSGFQVERYPHERIDQGYLSNGPEGAVRVRRKGERYFWTFKSAPIGHSAERVELETEITLDQFETLWPGTEGRRVEKIRYRIPYLNGHIIELDIFEGDNAGHMLAEVEFPSTAEADSFSPPSWFGLDVTADTTYGNASIAEHGFPE